MPRKNKEFRLGVLFTEEQTRKINQMSQLIGFIDPAKFVYYLIDKEYDRIEKPQSPEWDNE